MIHKKEAPIQRAKSVLYLYFTKANKHLPKSRKHMIVLAKEEMKILFGR